MKPADFLTAMTDREGEAQPLHDPATELPTAPLFLDRLTHALRRGARSNHTLGVLVIDVDQSPDPAAGSADGRLMLALAGSVMGTLRSSDTVARIGSGGLAVVLEDTTSALGAEQATLRLLDALQQPADSEAPQRNAAVRIGVAPSLPPHSQPQAVLCEAAAALQRAQAREGSNYAVFDAYQDAAALGQLPPSEFGGDPSAQRA